jgi:hypothetical protein
MRGTRVPLAVVVVLAALGLAGTAGTTIVATSGDVLKIDPPPSVRLGDLESNKYIFVFDEQQCVKTAQDLPVDITVPGKYNDEGDLTPGTIPAGTLVSSHFVHVDSKRNKPGDPVFYNGSITTDQDIIGIAILTDALNATDVLGAPGTAYPNDKRKFNLKVNDFVIEQVDLRTVTLHLGNHKHADQARVLTRCGQPPPPPPGGEGCSPGYWKQSHHFDSWVGYTPGDSFNSVFGVNTFPGRSLLGALWQGGGGASALGRQAVAALLNASSPNVDFDLTTAEVIQLTHDALVSGDPGRIESTKDQLESLNGQDCPLS